MNEIAESSRVIVRTMPGRSFRRPFGKANRQVFLRLAVQDKVQVALSLFSPRGSLESYPDTGESGETYDAEVFETVKRQILVKSAMRSAY